MNYDNVKNPFDMYDEEDAISEFEDEFDGIDYDEGEETPENAAHKSSRLMTAIMIISYIMLLLLAFLGIVGLCINESREAILHSVLFF